MKTNHGVRRQDALGTWTRMNQARIPDKLHGCKVTCARCATATWASAARSETLKGWRVEAYPDALMCPACVKTSGKVANGGPSFVIKQRMENLRQAPVVGFNGVCFERKASMDHPFGAYLYLADHKKLRLGMYATAEDAARAVDAAREARGMPRKNFVGDEVRGAYRKPGRPKGAIKSRGAA